MTRLKFSCKGTIWNMCNLEQKQIIHSFAHNIWRITTHQQLHLKRSGDIKENLGPKASSTQSFSICHWNLNIISAYNYIKLSLLRAYVSIHKFNVICISETYLDSDASTFDENLQIVCYILINVIHSN